MFSIKHIIKLSAIIILLSNNSQANNGMLEVKVELPYEKRDKYDDLHVYIHNKKFHLYENKSKTLFVDIIRGTDLYVLEPKMGYDKTDTVLLQATAFPEEQSIDINVKSTI